MKAMARHNVRKGIVLAGGRGTRLYPLTVATNKHLLPVHDKPMLYYPISTVMLGGIEDILIIANEEDLPAMRRLLRDGSHLGVRFTYAVQSSPRGIADALVVGEQFLAGDGCVLALGDNFFFGHLDFLRGALMRGGATLFAYPVKDLSRYGVVTLDAEGKAIAVEEKPAHVAEAHARRLAIPGLYVFDGRAAAFAKKLVPSSRGELEITDLLRAYLDKGALQVVPLGRGMAWLDMGTTQSLLSASEFVAAIELRQGLRIGCLEECAVRMGYVTKDAMRQTVQDYPSSPYRDYVEAILDEA